MEDAMKDDVVSFKTAKLAQEKGLNFKLGLGYKTHGDYYNYKGELNGDVTDEIKSMVRKTNDQFRSIPAPTLSLLQKRLREKYNVQVYVCSKSINQNTKYCDYVANINERRLNDPRNEEYQTYEEALDFGLYEALKELPTVV